MKRNKRTLALARQAWPERSETIVASPVRVSQRLDESSIQQLLADYEAGATGRQLAEQYGLARSTVIGLLRRHGVAVRHSRISSADATLAVELYRQGVREVDIARQLGRHKSLIWHVLQRAGVL